MCVLLANSHQFYTHGLCVTRWNCPLNFQFTAKNVTFYRFSIQMKISLIEISVFTFGINYLFFDYVIQWNEGHLDAICNFLALNDQIDSSSFHLVEFDRVKFLHIYQMKGLQLSGVFPSIKAFEFKSNIFHELSIQLSPHWWWFK